MWTSSKFAGVLAGLSLSLILVSQANAALMLCGVTDGSPGDLNAAAGAVSTTCTTSGGSFTGSLTETDIYDFDALMLTGTLIGNGTFSFSNAYTIGPWKGQGVEGAKLLLKFKDPTASQGTTTLTAFATTFDNNSAIAQVTPTIVFPPADTDINNGNFSGPGSLLGTMAWDVGTNVETLRIAKIWIDVPEPGSWILMVLGFGGLGLALRNRRAALAVG
jgi:hypothetical protein